MNYSIKEVAERLKGLREILGISAEEMAKKPTAHPRNTLLSKKARAIFP